MNASRLADFTPSVVSFLTTSTGLTSAELRLQRSESLYEQDFILKCLKKTAQPVWHSQTKNTRDMSNPFFCDGFRSVLTFVFRV